MHFKITQIHLVFRCLEIAGGPPTRVGASTLIFAHFMQIRNADRMETILYVLIITFSRYFHLSFQKILLQNLFQIEMQDQFHLVHGSKQKCLSQKSSARDKQRAEGFHLQVPETGHRLVRSSQSSAHSLTLYLKRTMVSELMFFEALELNAF